MKKTITSAALVCALLGTGMTADAASNNVSSKEQNVVQKTPVETQQIKLPGLSKTHLKHLKAGTYAVGGSQNAKLGRTFKDMTAIYGDSDVDEITRFGGGTLIESNFETHDGHLDLYYTSTKRRANEDDTKLAGMRAGYDNSKVTDEYIKRYIGKPLDITRDGKSTKFYSYGKGDTILEFEFRRAMVKSGNKKVEKWYVQSMTYGNSEF